MIRLKTITLLLTLFCTQVTICVFGQHKNYLMGRFDHTRDTSFIKVPINYAHGNVYLRKETYKAFLKMYKAALQSGVKLTILSGTRSFSQQRFKWELKWFSNEFSAIKDSKQKAIKLLNWWSMPGTSRHHWGTDVDLNNLSLAYYETSEGKKVYNWLIHNAPKFGFQQPFNANRKNGYREEKWHWSYVPLSIGYLRQYVSQISNRDINGFKGFQAANDLDLIRNWVLAINPLCK